MMKDLPKGFNKAKNTAEKILKDGKKFRDLINKGTKKAEEHKEQLGGFWGDTKVLFRMLKAHKSGAYKALSTKSLLYALASIVYFVNPLDIVPDFILGLGYLDDAALIGFVIKSIKKDMDAFMQWESSK